jgi:hypothetical protein
MIPLLKVWQEICPFKEDIYEGMLFVLKRFKGVRREIFLWKA